jgi:hypothetical protein
VRVNLSQIGNKNYIKFVLHRNLLNKTQFSTFFVRNLYGRYPKDVKFQNSEYEVHQVSLKYSGSQNFSFLAFKGEAVSFRVTTAMATARDRRNYFYRCNRVFYSYKVLKK